MEKSPTCVIIETAGGVGYCINISLATFSELPNENEEVKLLTYFIVKEDAQVLFGFLQEEERELFKLLITVNGIGPNTARLILSSMSVGELLNAISMENVKAIQSVKGIGAKTAQRIVLELADKMGVMSSGFGVRSSATNTQARDEAMTALTMLGFPKAAVEKLLTASDWRHEDGSEMTVEEIVKEGLRRL